MKRHPQALLERRLLPRVVSGASAGSIVAAMVATRTDAELRPMFEGNNVNLAFFRPLRSTPATSERCGRLVNVQVAVVCCFRVGVGVGRLLLQLERQKETQGKRTLSKIVFCLALQTELQRKGLVPAASRCAHQKMTDARSCSVCVLCAFLCVACVVFSIYAGRVLMFR